MAETVEKIAAFCMNAFYQSYRPADGFLRQEHFEWLCVAADAKLKQDEYNNQVSLNLKKRTPNAPIVMGIDNYITVPVTIENEKAQLPYPIMTLAGATSTVMVSRVVPEGNCSSVIPITPAERWEVENIKDVVFWMPMCDSIEFIHLKENCDPKKANVTYIPVLSASTTVADSRRWGIINLVNAYIKSAKEGVVVDMTNDANPNSSLQTEINKAVYKALSR